MFSSGSAKWMSTRCSMSVLVRLQATPYLQFSSSGLHLNPVLLRFSKMYISGLSSPTMRLEIASSRMSTCVFTCRLESPGVKKKVVRCSMVLLPFKKNVKNFRSSHLDYILPIPLYFFLSLCLHTPLPSSFSNSLIKCIVYKQTVTKTISQQPRNLYRTNRTEKLIQVEI